MCSSPVRHSQPLRLRLFIKLCFPKIFVCPVLAETTLFSIRWQTCKEKIAAVCPVFCLFIFGAAAPPSGQGPPHSWCSLDHTQWRTTLGRTPLDEWSAHHRDLYLTTHNTCKKDTSMPLVGIEPTISAGERPHTYALDHAATETCISSITTIKHQFPDGVYSWYSVLEIYSAVMLRTTVSWYGCPKLNNVIQNLC
jgi:hypothetical protein